MSLKLYNTLSRKKEIFKPLKQKRVHPVKSREAGIPSKTKLFNRVNLFVCGPTVYDFSHIGHARTYLVFDMITKYFRQKGFKVFYLQNITNIDDKIINRAKKEKKDALKLADFYEKEYLKDMKSLGVKSVNKYARATDYIPEIISQVKRLIAKGCAYQIADGIYYDIKKFKNYGKLSGRTSLQADDAVTRVDDTKDKRNKGDFCLWKHAKPDEPIWEWRPAYSRRGSPRHMAGRPGWHIEDTAITEKFFGSQYDIHGGGLDLIFPHHEAEIAQMEAISNKKLVRYWLHSGLLTIEGQKMAKSLGNFITIRDFGRKHSLRVLKFLVLKTHYRSPLAYTEKAVLQAKKELERIDEFTEKIQMSNAKFQINSKFSILKYEREYEIAMADDFNTPRALAVIFSLVSKGNALFAQNKLGQKDKKEILKFLKKVDEVFGFIFWKEKKEIPAKILKLAKEREKYRQENHWQKADEIRKEIKEMGYWLEDTKTGAKIKKV